VPWRGPKHPGDYPTLGELVGDWIEEVCVIPDGDHMGEPYELTAEMWRFLYAYYRVDPDTGQFLYSRGAQLVRPQKWGKGPFSGAIICAEAEGPVVFAGWDAAGEPVGRAWATPWIQVTAVSEDQTDNVFRALVPMIELGALADLIPDTGETRINLRGGGRIEPVTASARSRLGQRITFIVQDETHSWTKHNGGRRLADNQRRNLAGMSGRFLETTNAWDPIEESVAQQTSESSAPGVYLDDVDPGPGSVRNKRERRKCMKRVYGDSYWVDLDRIDAEIIALIDQGDPAQAERFFLNRKRATEGAAFDAERWAELAADPPIVIADKEQITIGIDGARWADALAIVATHLESGHQWPLGIWERPEHAGDDYEHPFDEVDGAMVDAFERYDVWRAYIDPQKIEHLVDRWAGRWNGSDRAKSKIVEWTTNRPKPIAMALRAYNSAIIGGDLTHDGDVVFARHIANARRYALNVKDDDGRPMWTLSKDRPHSPRKIDAAMAGCLSWEARGDAIAAGALKKRRRGVAGF
jgi:hypothetical protein